jgi:hypothetical protein
VLTNAPLAQKGANKSCLWAFSWRVFDQNSVPAKAGIHAACDALGNPVRFILTGGHVSDYAPCIELIAGFKPHAVLADKGYDGDSFISAINALGALAVVPPRKNENQ